MDTVLSAIVFPTKYVTASPPRTHDTCSRYNLKDMTWQTIVDTVVVGAMGPPGGGRNHITPRLLRHFNILCFLEFDDSTLTRIFKTIVEWHFSLNKVRASTSPGRGDFSFRYFSSSA